MGLRVWEVARLSVLKAKKCVTLAVIFVIDRWAGIWGALIKAGEGMLKILDV